MAKMNKLQHEEVVYFCNVCMVAAVFIIRAMTQQFVYGDVKAKGLCCQRDMKSSE